MSKGYSIRVQIAGRSFDIISNEKPEYLKSIAKKVDESISVMLKAHPEMTFERAAVLSALNYCDDASRKTISEYEKKSEDEANNLRQQVIQYANELSAITKKYKKLEKELNEIKSR